MRNAKADDAAVPSEDRNDGFYLIVSDLVSLIDHVQASMKLIEAAKVQDCIGNQEFADVVVLDDVTPLYTQAEAALAACNTNLAAALQFLFETKAVYEETSGRSASGFHDLPARRTI
ncbi:hypothetical protein [Bradyrhizobium sp. STM 3562]|uniref:hypothetical protein n=1 Tax=Bradyrhizobium sp. STM 3562 TaxID=578924 RepID=UPI003890D2F7